MAQIELRLSSKVQKVTGRSEIMIRFFQGNSFDLYAKSEIYINPAYFEYYINREKTEKAGVKVAGNIITASVEKATEKGYALRKSGTIVFKQRLETPEFKYHREQAERLEKLKNYILDSFGTADKDNMSSEWLKEMVDRFNHPEKYNVKSTSKSFYELVETYISRRQLAPSHYKDFYVLSRLIARYEGFIRATEKNRKDYTFEIDTVTREDLENLADYMRHEKELSEQYPKLFAKLIESYPASLKKRRNKVETRGENTVIKMRARLKSLFRFFVEEGFTTNRPFDGVKIGTAKVGTPIYISIEERNQIADYDLKKKWVEMDDDFRKGCKMPIKTIIMCRDIFIFQCFIGCRVGDLIKLTPQHIENGILVYTPHKTKDGEDAIQARIPLHPKALELIEKYKGLDDKGRLFPFITAQKYNDAIKAIFTMAEITRNVEVRNPLTGENEIRPINEIASSHLARRTFIGNAYFKVTDPNLIGKMSGHVEGSKAFKRYRKIEDETLKNVIDLIG